MQTMSLPEPRHTGGASLEAALLGRRSSREYRDEPIPLEQVSQLLWAAQGLTSDRFRTTPSAGALFPLELYLVAGNVIGLAAGVYRYRAQEHELLVLSVDDVRNSLARAAFDQDWIAWAPALLLFTAYPARTRKKYGSRGSRYVYMEAGHAAQNIYLQAASLDLGTVTVGAFVDEEVRHIMRMRSDEEPLLIMPVGMRHAGHP
jgi:SagB-type dehydrogenase family enzyme